jgi:hypothetical protein
MVAGENRPDRGRLRGRLRRNHGKGRGRNRHRRGYCLTLWGQQQHEADAGRRRDRRDRREPGRHSRPHVSESRPCQPHAEGPAMAKNGAGRATSPPSPEQPAAGPDAASTPRRPRLAVQVRPEVAMRHHEVVRQIRRADSWAARESGSALQPITPLRSSRRRQHLARTWHARPAANRERLRSTGLHGR